MIISVHTPKAGGGSFKEILTNQFGSGVAFDYSDRPINHPVEERTAKAAHFAARMDGLQRFVYKIKGVKCIHGHFMPFKYSRFLQDRDVHFVTWLRDPVERVISHYYYWKRTPIDSGDIPPLRRRIEAENWSLERFCLSEELRNLYQAFFWNFPIENFDFIGITESFDEDAAYFMERYFKKIKNKAIPKANANPDKIGKYSAKISPDFLKEIQEFHAEDYVLYRYALQRRAERISAGA
jgi:hypothetical protein